MKVKQSGLLERLFQRLLHPLSAFLESATGGSLALLAATALAVGLASVLGEPTVHHFWEQPLRLSLGEGAGFGLSLHHWVNDGLMAIFFFLIGLELKRELLVGELASLRKAILPVMAALGGVLCPALIYLAFNHDQASASGWAIPVATDIAFAVGILILLGSRVPRALIIFLTALAIADDLFAVLIIALFYAGEINLQALFAAAECLATLMVLNRAGVRAYLPYVLVGLGLWLATLLSGLHATLAGVLLAFCIPARSPLRSEQFEAELEDLRQALNREHLDPSPNDPFLNAKIAELCERIEYSAARVQTPLQRLEHRLSPWVAFLIIPLFALSNAGLDLGAVAWSTALHSPITLGVGLGLVFGKFVGIASFAYLTTRLGWGSLPGGVAWPQLLGAAWLGGIGFTMSLFISQLAFADPAAAEAAKIGILLASLVAALIGVIWLWRVTERRAS